MLKKNILINLHALVLLSKMKWQGLDNYVKTRICSWGIISQLVILLMNCELFCENFMN